MDVNVKPLGELLQGLIVTDPGESGFQSYQKLVLIGILSEKATNKRRPENERVSQIIS
mgnify:CR=1 FL=1